MNNWSKSDAAPVRPSNDRSFSACFEPVPAMDPPTTDSLVDSDSTIVPIPQAAVPADATVAETHAAGMTTVEVGHVKIQFGWKTKIVATLGALMALGSLIGSTVPHIPGVLPTGHFDQSSVHKFLESYPTLQKAPPTALELHPSLYAGHYKVWERNSPKSDGYAYYDTEFLKDIPDSSKSVLRRDTLTTESSSTASTVSTTTPVPSVTKSPPRGTEIDFKNFACNVLHGHWVCSRPSEPFCVYINGTVPAATKVVVTPLTDVPKSSAASEELISKKKCGDKIRVKLVDA